MSDLFATKPIQTILNEAHESGEHINRIEELLPWNFAEDPRHAA